MQATAAALRRATPFGEPILQSMRDAPLMHGSDAGGGFASGLAPCYRGRLSIGRLPVQPSISSPPFILTLKGLAQGVALSLPFVPGFLVFGAAVGTSAGQKGFSLFETMAMNGLVYAGASQLMALQLWTDHWTLTTLLAVVGVVAAVNLRFVLMGASLHPLIGKAPKRIVYSSLFAMADANWIITLRYHAEGGRDLGVLVGCSVFLWCLWVLAAIPGYLAGAFIDARTYGLDFAMLLTFTSMTVPVVRRARKLAPFAIAASVALLSSLLVPGYWFIIMGAIAGASYAALFGSDA